MFDDQTRQQPIDSFKGQLKNFQISFFIDPANDSSLTITVQNKSTLERFNRLIDRAYISEQEEFFKSVFEEPRDILDYIITCFRQTVIDNALFKFNYQYGGLKKKVKAMSIQLISVKSDQLQLANTNLAKMKQDFTSQLLQRDSKFNALQAKFEDLARTLLQYQTENVKQIKDLKSQLKQSNQKSKKMEQLVLLLENNRKIEEGKNLAKLTEELQESQRKIQDFDHKIYYLRLNQFISFEKLKTGELFLLNKLEWNNIEAIRRGAVNLHIIAKIISIQRKGKNLKAVFGDSTGTVRAFLRNDTYAELKNGEEVVIINAFAVEFKKNRLQIQLMLGGEIYRYPSNFDEVNLLNNITKQGCSK